jgi:hypothetical protein
LNVESETDIPGIREIIREDGRGGETCGSNPNCQ